MNKNKETKNKTLTSLEEKLSQGNPLDDVFGKGEQEKKKGIREHTKEAKKLKQYSTATYKKVPSKRKKK